jgi:hypothetical protein
MCHPRMTRAVPLMGKAAGGAYIDFDVCDKPNHCAPLQILLNSSACCTTMWCMKTEVYSWRLSSEVKSDLEREARERKVSVSSVLDLAVREWLKKNDVDGGDEEAQRRLHSGAASCLGVLARGNPERSETARAAVRERLRRRHAR